MSGSRRVRLTLCCLMAGSTLAMFGCGVQPHEAPPADFSDLSDDQIARKFASHAVTTATSGTEGAPALDVMQVKLSDAIQTLTDQNPSSEKAVLEAVDQVMESLFLSNLVPLPSAGAPEVDPMWGDHQNAIDQAIQALNDHLNNPLIPNTEDTSEAAWEARNFLQVFQEAATVIAQQTAGCDPVNPVGPGCGLLQAQDEGGAIVDDVFPGFSAQARSPFFVGAPSRTIQEQVIVPGVVADGECSVVLKEIQGIKTVIRPVLIPIWVEPWFARATIVGFKTVWVWEFVPAEFLKTISFCNSAGSVSMDVDIVTVLERQLLSFWSYPRKEFTAVP